MFHGEFGRILCSVDTCAGGCQRDTKGLKRDAGSLVCLQSYGLYGCQEVRLFSAARYLIQAALAFRGYN